MTISEIKKSFESLEFKYQLLDLTVHGTKIWQILRVDIYLIIYSKFYPATTTKSKGNKYKTFLSIIKNSIVSNPFYDLKRREVLIFESSRYLFVENEFIDIYTKYLCDELSSQGISFSKYRNNSDSDKISGKNSEALHLDFIFFITWLFKNFIVVHLNNEQNRVLDLVQSELAKLYGIKIDLKEIVQNEIKKFKIENFCYRVLLGLKKPKKIFFVAYNGKAALLNAAKQLSVERIELQHGYVMSKEDIIWDYPEQLKDKLEYFCDKFYSWENNYLLTANLPLSKENVILFGNRFLANEKKKYSLVKRVNNQILIASQPYLSNMILEYLLKNVQELKNFEIVYKLHPTEYQSPFRELVETTIEKYENIRLVKDKENIVELLIQSKYLVTVSSSVSLEALFLGTEVFLLDLPTIELVLPLVDEGRAIKIDFNEPLLNCIIN